MVKAVRGAIQCKEDSEREIAEQTILLVQTILEENTIAERDIICIQFTQTTDLFSLNCAAGLRQRGFNDIPLFCSQEPECKNSMPRVVRVLLTCTVTSDQNYKHIYLGGAEKLRPDIADS